MVRAARISCPVATDAAFAAAGHTGTRSRAGGPAGLTARETDVLALLAQGCPDKTIASRLGISPKTVGNHVERIYAKLGVSNRAAAAMRAMQYGLVSPEPAHAGWTRAAFVEGRRATRASEGRIVPVKLGVSGPIEVEI
jgi:DNA-binding CsgD family transcriptional regulator